MSNQGARWLNKIDHRLRAHWETTSEPDRRRQSVRVLVRFDCSEQSLKPLGVQVHSVAGNIASSTIALNDLPRIAAAVEIKFVELAQALGRDG